MPAYKEQQAAWLRCQFYYRSQNAPSLRNHHVPQFPHCKKELNTSRGDTSEKPAPRQKGRAPVSYLPHALIARALVFSDH